MTKQYEPIQTEYEKTKNNGSHSSSPSPVVATQLGCSELFLSFSEPPDK